MAYNSYNKATKQMTDRLKLPRIFGMGLHIIEFISSKKVYRGNLAVKRQPTESFF